MNQVFCFVYFVMLDLFAEDSYLRVLIDETENIHWLIFSPLAQVSNIE